MSNKNFQKGFTLMEVVVSTAIFSILSLSVYGVFSSIMNGIFYYRERMTIAFLADQYMEVTRNMPYLDIGTLEGNPYGNLPDSPNPISITMGGENYQIYYAISYVDDSADGTALLGTDTAPKDYKQVKLYIKNLDKNTIKSFLTNISPKGLEGMESGGALYIKVFNAVGESVSGATLHITNTSITPNIDITRLTDSNGEWVEVGLATSTNGYNIIASKSGYSTDGTYPITSNNPDPVKPHATVLDGQVTKVSFSIDLLSNLTFHVLNQSCNILSGYGLQVQGEKLIGTPNILKFDNTYTADDSGSVYMSDIEWDSYMPVPTNSSYMVYGSYPVLVATLLPDTSQEFSLIFGPKTTNALLVIVKDASTNTTIEGAEVVLESASLSASYSKVTGGSVLSQQDWSGGSGQSDFSDTSKYYQDDGNIDIDTISNGLKLKKIEESYASSTVLVSSSFDTGTSSTAYSTLTWNPTSQDAETSIEFQVAANNDNKTWNFIGPDGTSGTNYTVPGTTITNIDGNRYIRYKVFLSTSNFQKTPILTNININYVSGCNTPGQAIFSGLDIASDYEATVSADNYQSQTIEELSINGYNTLEIKLSQ